MTSTYQPTRFMAAGSIYDQRKADFAVAFIQALRHTKGRWAGTPFTLLSWQEQIVRDLFGTIKPDGYRQFTTAYVEIPKKQGKSELAAAIALLLTCGDGEQAAVLPHHHRRHRHSQHLLRAAPKSARHPGGQETRPHLLPGDLRRGAG